MLCGKTNRVVRPWRPRFRGNRLNGTRASPPPAGGAVRKCNLAQGQQVLATGAPEQLPSNLRLPDAHADIVSQLARPLSCWLYKKGVRVGDLSPSLGGQIHLSATCPDPSDPSQSAEVRGLVSAHPGLTSSSLYQRNSHRFRLKPLGRCIFSRNHIFQPPHSWHQGKPSVKIQSLIVE